MRTQEERIRQLHIRAYELQRQVDGKKTAGLGGLCTGLFALLVTCMIHVNDVYQNTAHTGLQGSSLLSESAGGYVLTAVIFFMLGVIISVTLIRYRRRKQVVSDPEFPKDHVKEDIDR